MSTDYLVPTTELMAVNEILAAIGEAPVGTLVGALPADAAMALSRLRTRSRSLQSQGWSFNTDFNYRLTPDDNNNIVLPPNALSADAVDNPDIVTRAQKLYDRRKHTFNFTQPVHVDIIRFLPFDELPEYARNFIFMSAGRRFHDQTLGDGDLHQFTAQDERVAWASFLQAEAEHGDYNVLSDSSSVSNVLKRRRR